MIELKTLKMSLVSPDPDQPRKLFSMEALETLKRSIKKYGIKNPLLVEEDENGKFVIIDGERRYRAAGEVGLKEVPVIIEKKKTGVDRVIEQFHIQEQHEGWTATEKAHVVSKLAKDLNITLDELCEALGITERQADKYIAFGKLINQTSFEKENINIMWAGTINNLKTYTKKVMTNHGKVFTKPEESRLEKVIISKIKDDEIKSTGDFTKLKDSFKKDPESVEAFLTGKVSPDTLFVKTKAKGAYHLRNVLNNGLQMQNHMAAFMAVSDVKVSNDEVRVVKQVIETAKKFAARYE